MLVANSAVPLAIPRPPAPAANPEILRVRELSAVTILVAAFGGIDAANADDYAARIDAHLSGYRQLVLDLSRLEFFGTAGYSVLHRVHARCAHTGVDWVLVPGSEVTRLLRICDPDAILPTAPNIVSAVATLARHHTGRAGLTAG